MKHKIAGPAGRRARYQAKRVLASRPRNPRATASLDDLAQQVEALRQAVELLINADDDVR